MNHNEDLEHALDISWAQADHIRIDPVRQLTGPGMLWDRTGAVVDVHFEDIDTKRLLSLWQSNARRVLDALGWLDEEVTCRAFQGGVTLAVSAPQDQLYSAVFAVQIVWHYCAADLLSAEPQPFDRMISDLKEVMEKEANPALRVLIAAATARNIDILIDEDEISIGHGVGSRSWNITNLPAPEDVAWSEMHDVPLAFITGTNGKTTTTRLCSAIARLAGNVVGQTSTDVVQVGDEILDRGDYSGPAGARMALRDSRVEIAFLEVARGGILRRGLATRRARVAVVTNIAKDHLGEYGITTLADMTQAKFAVARALSTDGVLVLNADDPNIVEASKNVATTICWFSLDEASPQITTARALGQPCAYLQEDALVFSSRSDKSWTIALEDVPITLSGAAKHNTRNALAAMCASTALGVSAEVIQAGLSAFVSDPQNNPGRFNEFTYNGARVIVDFAHNAHSIAAVCDAMALMPAKRRFLMLSQPGDHSDQVINEVTMTALQFRPDLIVTAEIADYLRGRSLDEIPSVIKASAIDAGISAKHVLPASSPAVGTKMILEQIQPGDLALLLVLSEREAVFKALEKGPSVKVSLRTPIPTRL
jgi:cyanophycin synthetase